MRACLLALAVAGIATTAAAATDGPPLRIALLVDTSASTRAELPQLRRGLSALVAAIPDGHEIALISTGRNVQTRVPPTLDRKKLQDSVNGLLPGDGPTPLMDAIVEIDERYMRKPGDRSPMFVIVTGDGTESSKVVDSESFNRWLSMLPMRELVVHAIVLKKGNGVPEVVASAMARNTGGHFETVGTGAQLAIKLKSLGEQIATGIASQRK